MTTRKHGFGILAVLFGALILSAGILRAAPVTISGTNIQDDTIAPPKMRAAGTPDNTMYPRYKSATEFEWAPVSRFFAFSIDNVVATDNVLLFRAPRAMTILRADCFASYDNVVGSLMECASDNVPSCTVLDSWTVTNAVNPFTDNTMADASVAAGAWLRWSTTSVGTASRNNFLCTVQYRE